jgi:hypothetical protein
MLTAYYGTTNWRFTGESRWNRREEAKSFVQNSQHVGQFLDIEKINFLFVSVS